LLYWRWWAPRWRGCSQRPRRDSQSRNGQATEKPGDPAQGRRIFFVGGCDSCHQTPNQPDPLQLGGGLELKTPFGSFYPPNISSDPVDGIGAWRAVDVANALLSGLSPRGQHDYPAFPYTSYQRMKPGDVADLIAFLRTLPVVHGRPPAHKLPFPFSIRRAVGLWKLRRSSTRSETERAMEPWPLSGRRPWPLRRMPHAAQPTRRYGTQPASGRCPGPGRQRQRAQSDRRSSRRLDECRHRRGVGPADLRRRAMFLAEG
jgi:hypothetical protein